MRSRFALELATVTTPRRAVDLAAEGVGRGRLAGPSWRAVARGWHVPAGTVTTTAQRIVEAAATLPPGGAIGGWAAAYVAGVDWLDGVDRWGRVLPVPLCVPVPTRRRPTDHGRYVRVPADELAVVRCWDLPIVHPARAVADAARWAPSTEEALVVVDAALSFGVVGQVSLTDALTTTSDRRGKRQARQALELAETGVESPWESRLRYCWVVEAGLPRPLVNPRLVDGRGRFLGRPDAFDPEAALVGEFDGRQHRERRQHRLDSLREEGLEGANLVVLRVDGLDLGPDRRPLVFRLRSSHHRGLARNRALDDWLIDRRS